MSNHEERRKSLITLSNVIQAADDEKYKNALDKCEAECEGLKSRISALESLLAMSGDKLIDCLSNHIPFCHELFQSCTDVVNEIYAILPATEDVNDTSVVDIP